MGLLSGIVLGLIAGIIGKWIMPNKQNIGLLMTILIGIAGAVIGGFVGTLLGLGHISGLSIKSILLASAGATLVLWLKERKRR